MRRGKCLVLVMGLVLAGGCALPSVGLADDNLDDLKKQQAIAEAKLAILKAQQEQGKLEATAEKGKIDALKALVDAQAALEKGTVTKDLATVSALKEVLGASKTIGEGGAVTAGKMDMPFLLWSRMGGVDLLEEAAEAMCNGIQTESLLVPTDLTARRQAMNIFDTQTALLKIASAKMINDLKVERQRIKSVAAVIGLATTGLYAVGAVSDLIKSLRTDRAVVLSSVSRADVFERVVMGSSKCLNVAAVDWQAAVLNDATAQFLTRNEKLESLREAYGQWSVWKTQAEDGLDAAKKINQQDNAKAVAKAHDRMDKVLSYTGLADSLKQFLAGTSAEAVMKVAETAALVQSMADKNKSGLTYTLTVHDLQVNASGMFGKGLRRVPMVELQYTVTDLKGNILKTGYFAKKGVEKTIEWDKEESFPRNYGRPER